MKSGGKHSSVVKLLWVLAERETLVRLAHELQAHTFIKLDSYLAVAVLSNKFN